MLSNKFQQRMLQQQKKNKNMPHSHISLSKGDCTICRATTATNTISQVNNIAINSTEKRKRSQSPTMPLEEMVQQNLRKQAQECGQSFSNCKIVNDLIYNENSHMVSVFKDYLILDDINEFLKRSYARHEAEVRLPKLCNFYEQYSQLFPNYVNLPESKFMFRNIQRKQKIIDENFNLQQEHAKKGKKVPILDDDRIFSSQFVESVMLRHGNISNMSRNGLDEEGEVDQETHLSQEIKINGGDINLQRKNSAFEQQIQMSVTQFKQNAAILNKIGSPATNKYSNANMTSLVNAYLLKDTENTIQLNTSMGNLGAGILDSFVTNRDSDAHARFKAMTSLVDDSDADALDALDAIETVDLVAETHARSKQFKKPVKPEKVQVSGKKSQRTNAEKTKTQKRENMHKKMEDAKKLAQKQITDNGPSHAPTSTNAVGGLIGTVTNMSARNSRQEQEYKQEREDYLENFGIDRVTTDKPQATKRIRDSTPSAQNNNQIVQLQAVSCVTNNSNAPGKPNVMRKATKSTTANKIQPSVQKPVSNFQGIPVSETSLLQIKGSIASSNMKQNTLDDGSKQYSISPQRAKDAWVTAARPVTQQDLGRQQATFSTNKPMHSNVQQKKHTTPMPSKSGLRNSTASFPRHKKQYAEEEIAEEDCIYDDIEVEEVPMNNHLTSHHTRNTNNQTDAVSLGSTIEDANEDHESPMDERGARRAERFMLCPSVMVPNHSQSNQMMFSSGERASVGGSGTKTESINKITNNEQNRLIGGNQYFKPSQIVETRAKTSTNHIQLDNLHVNPHSHALGSRSPAISAQHQQQLAHLTEDQRSSLTRQKSALAIGEGRNMHQFITRSINQRSLANYKDPQVIMALPDTQRQRQMITSESAKTLTNSIKGPRSSNLAENTKYRNNQERSANNRMEKVTNAYQQPQFYVQTPGGRRTQIDVQKGASVSRDSNSSHGQAKKAAQQQNILSSRLNKQTSGTRSNINLRTIDQVATNFYNQNPNPSTSTRNSVKGTLTQGVSQGRNSLNKSPFLVVSSSQASLLTNNQNRKVTTGSNLLQPISARIENAVVNNGGGMPVCKMMTNNLMDSSPKNFESISVSVKGAKQPKPQHNQNKDIRSLIQSRVTTTRTSIVSGQKPQNTSKRAANQIPSAIHSKPSSAYYNRGSAYSSNSNQPKKIIATSTQNSRQPAGSMAFFTHSQQQTPQNAQVQSSRGLGKQSVLQQLDQHISRYQQQSGLTTGSCSPQRLTSGIVVNKSKQTVASLNPKYALPFTVQRPGVGGIQSTSPYPQTKTTKTTPRGQSPLANLLNNQGNQNKTKGGQSRRVIIQPGLKQINNLKK